MLKGLTKLVAYKKAPRKTFALLHPIKALKWGAAFYVGKRVWNKVSGGNDNREEGSTRPRRAGADTGP